MQFSIYRVLIVTQILKPQSSYQDKAAWNKHPHDRNKLHAGTHYTNKVMTLSRNKCPVKSSNTTSVAH